MSAEARDAEEARCPIHDWCDGPRGHSGQCAPREPGEGTFADGVRAALKIVEDWRAREVVWKERAKNDETLPARVDRARLLEDASTRESVLRGAAADIRQFLETDELLAKMKAQP